MNVFDRDLARLLLEICRYTYAATFDPKEGEPETREIRDSLKARGNPDALVLLKDDTAVPTSVACVAAYPDKNVVAYMGTKTEFSSSDKVLQSVEDWLQNFEALLVPFKLTAAQLGRDLPEKDNLGGRVHHGFWEELTKVQEKVVRELLARGGISRPLYVTGHSQGGAEAALATRAFLAAGFQVAATYTFAAPRAGNPAFARSIPAAFPFHRIEFGNDIVPHVPPTRLKQLRELLTRLPMRAALPDRHREIFEAIMHFSSANFVGTGKLCYGDNDGRTLCTDLSAQAEKALFLPRLWKLLLHPKDWGAHHHLAGTSEDLAAGRKGNYTALVSNFQLEP